jgi:stage V sporulation protein SpoVS
MAGLGALNPDVELNNNTAGGGFTVLPDDDYELEIIESDVKANSKGTGQNLDWKVQVASGPHKGVTFFSGITSIQHESAQAQAIGQGQLKAACRAMDVDFGELTDSEQLHFKPFWASVRSETYFSNKHKKDMTKNVIAKFLFEGMDDEPAPASPEPPATKSLASTPPPANANADTGKKRRPWEK